MKQIMKIVQLKINTTVGGTDRFMTQISCRTLSRPNMGGEGFSRDATQAFSDLGSKVVHQMAQLFWTLLHNLNNIK